MKYLALIGIVVLIMTVFTSVGSVVIYRYVRRRINNKVPLFKQRHYVPPAD